MNLSKIGVYRNDAGQTEADLLIGEIANLINEKPLTVIQTISATTNKEFVGTTYGDLTKAVGELLKTNKVFASAMVALVYLNAGLLTHDEISAISVGDYSVLNKQIDTVGTAYHNISGAGMDMVSAIVGAVGNITSGSLQLASAKAQAKGANEVADKNLEAARTQAEAATATSKEGTKTALLNTLGAKYAAMGGISGTTILIFIAILAIGGGALLYFNRSSSKPALSSAPAAPPAPAPAPSPAPVVNTPPKFDTGGGISPALDGIKTS